MIENLPQGMWILMTLDYGFNLDLKIIDGC